MKDRDVHLMGSWLVSAPTVRNETQQFDFIRRGDKHSVELKC